MITKYSTVTLDMDELKQVMLEYLKKKNLCIPEDATVDVKENDMGTYVLIAYAENVDKAEDKPQASADACSNKDSYDGQEDPKGKTCIYPTSINDLDNFYNGKKDLTWDEMCGR